ncbi:MAG: polyphosphate kinase 2 family protein [Clostridiaceae bacterium]
MKLNKYTITEGRDFKLKDHETRDKGSYESQTDAAEDMALNLDKLQVLQDKLYAQNQYAILLIIQAMDAAGKDGLIKHVMSGVNPQGCQVFSFKQPSTEELDHDYLWRCVKNLPERGRIGIFNRSYYEDVLVVRVHNLVHGSQVPQRLIDKNLWVDRFGQIRNFEDYLVENGIIPIKIFLNVSKNEQKQRFLDRIEDPSKNWKFSAGDISERALWDDYMNAYEDAIKHTSTEKSPWHIIPADRKWFARLLVSEIIVQKMEELNLVYPVLAPEELVKLEESKQLLLNE